MCWDLVQITKKLCATQPWFPKDLSISNDVTVGVSHMYPRRPNTGIMLPHKRWRWSRRSRPQGREDLRAMTSAPHERHLYVLAHVWWPRWLPEPHFQPRCGSRQLWTGIWKLCNMTACRGDDSRLLHSPSGGHAGERERQRAVARASPAHQEVVGGGHGGGLVGCVVHLSSWDPLYIVGRGASLPLHQGTRRRWPRRRRRAAAARAGAGRPPRNPNPGRPGRAMAPPFFLYSLIGFFQ
jgi:hypothetical protein